MSGHAVEWTLEEGGIEGSLVCHEPDGADCRLHCPVSPYCDEAGLHILRDEAGPYHLAYVPAEQNPLEEERHDLVAYPAGCVIQEWSGEAGGAHELYDGPKTQAQNGPVTVWWEGEDGPRWAYPTPQEDQK